MIRSYVLPNFSGGISGNTKTGLEGAAQFMQSLNIHEDPTYLTPNLLPTKVSGTTVTDLVKWIVDANPWDTNRYFYGNTGNLYKETSGGVWSLDRAGSTIGNSTTGQGLMPFDDYLYYATSTTIGRKGKLSGTPTFNDDFFTDGTTNLDQSKAASGQTYTTPTSISETATNKMSFTPTKDPVKEIDIIATAKGTGNWTLTVHDANNILIGSQTITNANLVVGTNAFIFATPLRVVNGNTYHFHVTSTVADGTVQTGTTADLSTANYNEFFGILVADANFHPMVSTTTGLLIIGNERYLATWDEVTYKPNAIALPAGFQVRALWKENEFIVAAAWRGQNTTNVLEASLFYWDGSAPQYNFPKPISQGLPHCGINFKNRTLTILGQLGDIYLGTEPFQHFQLLPTLTPHQKRVEIYPGAITIWQNRVAIGVAGFTDDPNLYQGVFTFGNITEKLPEVMNYDFVSSSGVTQNSAAQIGAVTSFGKDLYFSWFNGTATYGVDKVQTISNPATSGTWQSLIFDDSNAQKKKLFLRVKINHTALVSGESITIKWKIERAAAFTAGSANSVVGSTSTEAFINLYANEFEYGFTLQTGTTFPRVIAVTLEYNDLSEERLEG